MNKMTVLRFIFLFFYLFPNLLTDLLFLPGCFPDWMPARPAAPRRSRPGGRHPSPSPTTGPAPALRLPAVPLEPRRPSPSCPGSRAARAPAAEPGHAPVVAALVAPGTAARPPATRLLGPSGGGMPVPAPRVGDGGGAPARRRCPCPGPATAPAPARRRRPRLGLVLAPRVPGSRRGQMREMNAGPTHGRGR